MYAEVREEVVLASEVATLLEEPIAEHRSEHQCSEQFTPCSVSVSCSYENTILFDPLMETVVPKTLTREDAVAITSDSHLEPKVTFPPFVHPSEVLNPSKESITQRNHFPMIPSCQKPFPSPITLHNNFCYTWSTCNRANKQHMVVFMTDTFLENVPAHTLDRPNNRYRKWISCKSLHHFSPHGNRSQTGLHTPISLNLLGGEVSCCQKVYLALRCARP